MTWAPSACPSWIAAIPLPPDGAEHGQPVARGDLAAVDEADPPGEVRDPEAGRLGIGEAVGNRKGGVRGDQAFLGEGAAPLPEHGDAHDPGADGDVDTLAHRGHGAGGLLARGEGEGRGERIRPATHEDIGQPDAGGR